MTEETQVAEETIVQEAVAQEPPQKEEAQETQPRDVDINWARANEVLRLQKQRIEDLESKIASQPQKHPEKEPLEEEDPEDYATVAKTRKIASREAQEAAKQAVEELLRQQRIVDDEKRMRDKHEDFDFMIENFAIPMIKNDPALAYKIQNSKNPAETAYKLALLSDEYEVSLKNQTTSPKAEKIIKNSQRPVSSHAVPGPLKTQADDFSKMSPQEIWNMSQKYARGG